MYTCSLSSLWLLRSLYLYGLHALCCDLVYAYMYAGHLVHFEGIQLIYCVYLVCFISTGLLLRFLFVAELVWCRWFTPTPNTLVLLCCQNGFSALLLVDQLAVGILNYHHLDWATWLKCHLLRSSNLLISLIIIFDLSPRNLNSVASMHHSSL